MGCIAEDRSACPHPRGVSVRLTVCPDPMTAVPRAADEEALRDLNLYLYDDDGEIVLHRYQSSSTLRFTSLPGNYRMRIAANMGRDLGENPASEDFTVTHADEYDTLPMSYEGEVSIPSSDETVTLPTVEVQRLVAKITYSISVAPDAGDIRLHSVQPINLPARVRVFDPGRPAAEYTAGGTSGTRAPRTPRRMRRSCASALCGAPRCWTTISIRAATTPRTSTYGPIRTIGSIL